MTEIAERCRRYEIDKYTLCYWINGICMMHSEWDSTGDRIITPALRPFQFLYAPVEPDQPRDIS